MKKKKFSLIEEYKKSWRYIIDSKNFIFLVVAIFLIFAIIGFIFPIPDILKQQILDFMKKLVEETKDLSQLKLILYIISNNVQSSFMGILFGFLYGIFPMGAVIVNGYILGFVASLSVQSIGYSSLWKILPHGVFPFRR